MAAQGRLKEHLTFADMPAHIWLFYRLPSKPPHIMSGPYNSKTVFGIRKKPVIQQGHLFLFVSKFVCTNPRLELTLANQMASAISSSLIAVDTLMGGWMYIGIGNVFIGYIVSKGKVGKGRVC